MKWHLTPKLREPLPNKIHAHNMAGDFFKVIRSLLGKPELSAAEFDTESVSIAYPRRTKDDEKSESMEAMFDVLRDKTSPKIIPVPFFIMQPEGCRRTFFSSDDPARLLRPRRYAVGLEYGAFNKANVVVYDDTYELGGTLVPIISNITRQGGNVLGAICGMPDSEKIAIDDETLIRLREHLGSYEEEINELLTLFGVPNISCLTYPEYQQVFYTAQAVYDETDELENPKTIICILKRLATKIVKDDAFACEQEAGDLNSDNEPHALQNSTQWQQFVAIQKVAASKATTLA